MVRVSRFFVAGFAALLTGSWSFAAAAQVPPSVAQFLNDHAAQLLNDPNFCWETENLSFQKVTITSKELKARLAGPRSRVVEVELDLKDPATPRIVTRNYQQSFSGKSYTRVPCPPPVRETSITPPPSQKKKMSHAGNSNVGDDSSEEAKALDRIIGLNTAFFIQGTRLKSSATEFDADTGAPLDTDILNPQTRVGGGGQIGFAFPVPLGGPVPFNNVLINPFVEFADPNTKAQEIFAGGGSIRVSSNFEFTGGVQIGPVIFVPGVGNVNVYGIVAGSVEKQKFTFDFSPISTSENKIVSGLTFGGGAAIALPQQIFGLPTQVFVNIEHTDWQNVTINTPAAAPFTNFKFNNSENRFQVGVRMTLNFRNIWNLGTRGLGEGGR